MASREVQEQRISFSKFLTTGSGDNASERMLELEGGLDQSTDFEFMNPFSSSIEADQEEESSGRFPADELFYNGKMLPLEPVSRMAMVKDLNIMLRRGRSAPPSPYFDPASNKPSTTRKSSSYPPRGRRLKDFFGGLKKFPNPSQQVLPQSVFKTPTSNSSASSSGFLRNMLGFGKKAQIQQISGVSRPRQQQQQPPVARKNRGISSTEFTRSAPSTPLHPRATPGAASGFLPVLHLPLPKFFSSSHGIASSSSSNSRSIEVL